MRVAVTGAGGRLGTALRRELAGRPFAETVLAWDLPEHDLDDPRSAERLVRRDSPDIVVHAGAWTDVDGCALQPELAMRRNGTATGELARACAASGASLITISTNEVFDGRRTDGVPYAPDDEPNPINPYGASKLAGEREAAAAFGEAAVERLGIVRTAWLFGPGAPDFPTKILAAARLAAATGEPLKAVADEWGNPTYTVDLARAIVRLVESVRFTGIHHVVSNSASRADWVRDVVARAGLRINVVEVPASTWPRPSTPPRWGVLRPTPLPTGPLRPWAAAMAEYAPDLLDLLSRSDR